MKRYHDKYGIVHITREEGAQAVRSTLRIIFLLVVILYAAWFITRPLPASLEEHALSPQAIGRLQEVNRDR